MDIPFGGAKVSLCVDLTELGSIVKASSSDEAHTTYFKIEPMRLMNIRWWFLGSYMQHMHPPHAPAALADLVRWVGGVMMDCWAPELLTHM